MLQLIVPAGAVSSATTFSIQPITNHCPGGNASAFRLLPEGITFAQPVTVNLFYSDTITANEEYLTIAFQDTTKAWFAWSSSTIDTSINKISVNTKHFCSVAPSSRLGILPDYAIVFVNESLALAVNVVGETARFTDRYGDICVGFVDQVDFVFEWGVWGGYRYGRIEKKGDHAGTYFAPASVPINNPIATVWAKLSNITITVNGQTLEQPEIKANILIIDNELHFLVAFTSLMDSPDVLFKDKDIWFAETDTAGMTVIIKNGKITVEDIYDQKCTITPMSITAFDGANYCTYTILNTGDGYYNSTPGVVWTGGYIDASFSTVAMAVTEKFPAGVSPTYMKQCIPDTNEYRQFDGEETNTYPVVFIFEVGKDYQEEITPIIDGSNRKGRFYKTAVTKLK